MTRRDGETGDPRRARPPERLGPSTLIPDGAILDMVAGLAGRIREATAFIHAHPELAFEEHQCSEYLAAMLEQAGLTVERGIGGMPTAFRATLIGARTGRTVGLVTVYDALPAVGLDGIIVPVHSCGHGPQAAGVVGAAAALAALRDQLAGSVVILGLPADETTALAAVERGGGKEISVRAGLWQGLDAALYAHPEFIDAVLPASLWMRQDVATIKGRLSIKDCSAQDVLDAVGPALSRIRAALPHRLVLERATLSGNVEDGCQLVLEFRFAAPSERELDKVARRLRAELPDAEWRERRVVPSIRADKSVQAIVGSAMAAVGRTFAVAPPMLPHATDFGYVSRAVPAALIGLGRDGGWSMHTDEGAELFAGTDGDDVAIDIARVLALASARITESA